MAARAFIGGGDLYIARYVSGAFESYKGPFECEKFEIKPNVDLKEKKSKGKSTYGQVIETVALPEPADLSISLSEVNKESFAIAMLGTVAALNQASGTLTAVDVVIPALNVWVELTKARLTGSPLVTNAGATVTYVNGVDYILNGEMGWIKALSTGAIVISTIKLTSTYGAITGDLIRGMTDAQLRARFKLDGINFVDKQPVIVTVHEAAVAADAAFDFLADDFSTIEMPGRMKTPVGFIEPFTIHLRDIPA